MITIPLPPKSVLVIEQCHHGVPVGRGGRQFGLGCQKHVWNLPYALAPGKELRAVGLPGDGDSRTFALGKMFKNKVG